MIFDSSPKIYPKSNYYYKRSNVRIRLGSDRKMAFTKYGEIMSSSNPNKTFADIAVRYRLEVLTLKRPSSQKTESYSLDEIIKVFGGMFPQDLRPSDIYQYMDIRSKTSVSMANRARAALSNLCNSAIRWGLMDDNPCRLVKKIPIPPRQRLISTGELEAFKAISPKHLKYVVELAYITGARQGELLSLKFSDIQKEGLHLFYSKNSKQFIIEWAPKLKAIIEHIKKHASSKKIRSLSLLTGKRGKPFTANSFSSLWQKNMALSLKKNIISERFTFHDIRAMAITHMNSKRGLKAAQELVGHSTDKTTKQIYT